MSISSMPKRTQTKLLERDASLTLDTALDIARTEEVYKQTSQRNF